MISPESRITARLKKRNLPELLVHKFLTEYGYDHGPVIARAIVDDILDTVERCYPKRVSPKTVIWLAVRLKIRDRMKGISISDLVPIQLRVYTEEEIELLTDPGLRKRRQARHAFNRARFARWCFEAYEQGGVLTQLDLSLLSGLSEDRISAALRKYETETGTVVPTRGTVHDMGPAITHKGEIVRRWLQHQSPLRIAQEMKHSQTSVDRYIADYQKVRLLAQKVPFADLPALTGMSPALVNQYTELLRDFEPDVTFFQEREGSRSSTQPPPAPEKGTR
jgi:hypothetical protein